MSSLSMCAQPEADVWPLITFVQLKNPTLLNRSPAMTTTPRWHSFAGSVAPHPRRPRV